MNANAINPIITKMNNTSKIQSLLNENYIFFHNNYLGYGALLNTTSLLPNINGSFVNSDMILRQIYPNVECSPVFNISSTLCELLNVTIQLPVHG